MVGGGSAPSQLSFDCSFRESVCICPELVRADPIISRNSRHPTPKGGSYLCCASRIQKMHVHSHGAAHNHSHPPIDVSQGMTLILGTAVVATFALVAVELIAGYAAHSIALISDAFHNLTDVPTMVISWLAARWAMRPPTPIAACRARNTRGRLPIPMLQSSIASTVTNRPAASRPRRRSGVMFWVSILALDQ